MPIPTGWNLLDIIPYPPLAVRQATYRRLGCLLLAAFLLTLQGCLAYHPEPLTWQSVETALSLPSDKFLNQRLQALRGPFRRAVAIDGRDGLSPDEAALLAVLVNPSLRIERDRRGIAGAQLLQAGLLPNPQFTFAFAAPTGGTTAGATKMFGFDLNWQVTALIWRAAQIDSARAHTEAVDVSVAWAEQQVAQSARMALYRLIVLNRQAELAAAKNQRLSTNLERMRQASDKGLITGLDLNAARTARNQSYNNLLGLRQQQTRQRLLLKRALGVPAGAAIAPQAAIGLPDHLEIPPLDRLVEGVEDRRFDLLALRRGYESQEAALHVAVLKQFPKISIGFHNDRDNGNINNLGLGIFISLPVFDHNQGAIASKTATRQQLYDEYINRLFVARSKIATLTANIDALNHRIDAVEAALPPLQALVENYRAAVDQGQADVLNFYIVWNRLTDQRIKLLSLEQNLIENRVGLELAAGLQCIGRTAENFAGCLPTTLISERTETP